MSPALPCPAPDRALPPDLCLVFTLKDIKKTAAKATGISGMIIEDVLKASLFLVLRQSPALQIPLQEMLPGVGMPIWPRSMYHGLAHLGAGVRLA